MASKVTKVVDGATTVAKVVPVRSLSKEEAKSSVLAVYKQLQRRAPNVWWNYGFQDMPLSYFRLVLKKEFLKNAHLKDIRVIDRKIDECKQHIYSLDYYFYNGEHLRNYLFHDGMPEKPKDFMSKFLLGTE